MRPLLVGSALSLVSLVAMAQAPVIEKVEPPTWWANHSVNPVRVLVRGKHLTGANFVCATVTCSGVKVNAAGTYAFVDVTIPKATKPGQYPMSLRTTSGRAEIAFRVNASLPKAGRFQGFSSDDVVYLIMPDRFANGDPSNDATPATQGMLDRAKPRYYHGGDLAGIRQKLPYLKSLGVTAIWMTPVYDNNNALNQKETYDGQPITDYHGYGATDMYAVDEHLGDTASFRQLVDDAHAQGIKVIQDHVANHVGPYHPWVANAPTPTWFHGTEASHPNNTWQVWTLADPHATPASQQATLDGWFINILPDFNQDDPEVARYIIQNTLWWVGTTGLDGIRQDTWPYVPRTFWREWMTAIKREYPQLRVVGEVLDGDPALVSFFQGGRKQFDGVDDKVDALFDFPLFYPIRNAFARGGSLRSVAQALSRDHLYPDPNNLMTLVGLHDVSRFMSETGATPEGLKLAYTFLLTSRGIPLIYYGDEIALPGGNDPDNRRDFPGGWAADTRNAFEASGRTSAEQSVWQHVQQVAKLRAARPELRKGKTENLIVGEQTWVYKRGSTIVALNNGTVAADIALPLTSLAKDALGVCGVPKQTAAGLTITVPARSGCIF